MGEIDKYSYNLGGIGAFSELINAGVKKMALSAPMTPSEMDRFIEQAEKVADNHNVSVYRESDLLVTDLFPADVSKGLDVLLLYQGTTKDEYLSLKAEKKDLISTGEYNEEYRRDISRQFGRMLSYSPRKINLLLSQNTSFRTMDDFGVIANNLFLYYKDLNAASEFYSDILGLEMISDYGMAKIFRIASSSYIILVDASKGMHSADEPKTVALALLTDQLAEWYTHLTDRGVEIKYAYNPKAGSPHDGFVAIDPEGYFLEFEKFNQHPENEDFVPILNKVKSISNHFETQNQAFINLGFKASITWLYFKDILSMQEFYQDVLGLVMVADQGWAKIYRVTDSGYIGLVDEKRGMHKFTEKKAVNVSFILEDLEGWYTYANERRQFALRSDTLEIGPENKYKAFAGYDPEGYYLEFDKFYEHEDNTVLLKYLVDHN